MISRISGNLWAGTRAWTPARRRIAGVFLLLALAAGAAMVWYITWMYSTRLLSWTLPLFYIRR